MYHLSFPFEEIVDWKVVIRYFRDEDVLGTSSAIHQLVFLPLKCTNDCLWWLPFPSFFSSRMTFSLAPRIEITWVDMHVRSQTRG